MFQPGLLKNIKKQNIAFDSPYLMFFVALLVRLIVVSLLYEEQLSPDRDYFHFGWETGRVARSIANGQGFSSPLSGQTGPTAWVPPGYAYLLAGVFKLFGVYTAGSAIFILSLNSLFSALTCFPVFYIAKKIFGRQTGAAAGWLWAFFPYAIDFAAQRVWGDCLNALLFSLVFLSFLHLSPRRSALSWLGLGVLSGLAALNNATILLVVPLLTGWAGFVEWKNSRSFPFRGIVLLFGLALIIAPWCIRNYLVFNQFIPLRNNFWLEVRVGNTGDTSDFVPDWAHPATNRAEMESYRQRGELAYMIDKRQQAIEFITTEPGTFLCLTIRRIFYMWTGMFSFHPDLLKMDPFIIPNIFLCTPITLLALVGIRSAVKTRQREIIPFLIVLLSYPGVYYITHVAMDYRHPIDPLIVILCVQGVTQIRSVNRHARAS